MARKHLDLSAAETKAAAPKQRTARQLEKYQTQYQRAVRLLNKWITKSARASNSVKKYQQEAARLEKLLRVFPLR